MTLVLIIDDFLEARKDLKAMLGSMGIESVSVCDGQSGLALLQSSLHPDLVISEVNVPGMDAIELYQATRQHSQLDGTNWIFMSSSAPESVGLEAGCASFLGKPFNLEDLKRAMAGIPSGQPV